MYRVLARTCKALGSIPTERKITGLGPRHDPAKHTFQVYTLRSESQRGISTAVFMMSNVETELSPGDK